MTSLLFITSFLIHVVLILIVYWLFQQFQQLKQSRHQEMETILDTFLQDIKAENDLLKQQIQQQSVSSSQKEPVHEPLDKKEPMHEPLDKKHHNQSAYSEMMPPIMAEEKQDAFEPSIQGQVYQLFDEGYSAENIAKKLHRGKTEIDLMLKFKQK